MKTIRPEIFEKLQDKSTAAKYLQPGKCGFHTATGSRRLFIGETTRQYWTREKYESPEVGNTEAYVNYRLDQASGDLAPEEREVPVCLKGEERDEHTVVLCYMTLPVKKEGVTTEEFLAEVEDKLTLTLAVRYIYDCLEAERRERATGGSDEIIINDF